MKNDFFDGKVVTRKVEDLTESERLHLEKICEIGHQKNMRMKEEALDKQRRYSYFNEKKRREAVSYPLLFSCDEVLIVKEVDMDWRTTKLSLSKTLPIYIGLSIM